MFYIYCEYLLESMFKIMHTVDCGLSLDVVQQTPALYAFPMQETLKVLGDQFCMEEVCYYWPVLLVMLLCLPPHEQSLPCSPTAKD